MANENEGGTGLFEGNSAITPADIQEANELEQETNNDTEQEASGDEQDTQEEETPTDETEGQEGDEEEAYVRPEDAVDLEIDGETYVIPKKLEAAFMRQKDYTSKTQELAEQRKTHEARQIGFQDRVKMQEALLDDITEIKATDARLSEYSRVDWQAANMRDPTAAQAAWFEYQQLKEFRQAKVAEIDGKIAKRQSDSIASERKLVQETVAALTPPDSELAWPGHSTDTMNKVKDFATKKLGISETDLKRVKSPVSIKTLNLARIGYEYLQTMKAKTAKTTVPAEPVKQVQGNKSLATVDPMKLPMDKWVIAERKRMAKKNGSFNPSHHGLSPTN